MSFKSEEKTISFFLPPLESFFQDSWILKLLWDLKKKNLKKEPQKNPIILPEWYSEVEGEVWDVLTLVTADTVFLRNGNHRDQYSHQIHLLNHHYEIRKVKEGTLGKTRA